MKVSAYAPCLLLASSASAFAPSQPAFAMRPLAMAGDDDSSGGALVPIKEETVEFTAGLVGGGIGFLLGGPVLGAIGAAAANYVSKMEGSAADVVQEISKSSLYVFNYLATLDGKYEILKKAQVSLKNSLETLKKQDSVDPTTITKVEEALETTNNKIKEINDEYDLVGGGVTALGIMGDLIEKAVVKMTELNEEYNLSEKATEALASAVDKAKAAAKQATP
jgi:rRNA maturation endonuclease Nob1